MAEPYTYARTIDELAGIDTGPLEYRDPRYVDLAEARGDDPIPRIVRRFALARKVAPTPVLLLAQRGAGTSTELRRLAGELQAGGFRPVVVDAERALSDGGVAEFILALVEQVVRTTRVPKDVVDRGARFYAPIRTAPRRWTPLPWADREGLRRNLGELVDWAKEVFRVDGASVVLLVDNLARLPIDRVGQLLTESWRALSDLRCPIVLGAPASLRSHAVVGGGYAVEELPLVRLQSVGGIEDYFAILNRRCDASLFEAGALREVAQGCGGDVRDLIRLTTIAATESRHSVVDIRSVKAVLARAQFALISALPDDGLHALARLDVAREGRLNKDFDYLLDSGAALSFARMDVVHPLVKTSSRYQWYLEAARSTAAAPGLREPASPELPPTSVVLTGFAIRDFRGLTSLSVTLPTESKLPGSWLCVAGVNGAGKSAALQAISLALLGDELARELGRERLARMVRRSESDTPVEAASIKLRLRFDDEPEVEVELRLDQRGVSGGSDDAQLLQMRRLWRRREKYPVLSYGANRSLSDYPDTRHVELALDVRRQMTLFDPLAQVANVDVLLREGRPLTGAVPLFEKLVKVVFPDFSMLVEPGRGVQFMLTERPAVEAVDLPDGFRATLAWLADLCTAWLEKVGPLAQDPDTSDIRAIVLIDEIDLHLHPSLQRTLVPRLRAALPAVQWIVTTHSPLILSCFDRSEIVLLDHRAPDGIRVPDRQILGFTMDQIYRWLMDTQPQGGAITELLERADPSGAGVSEQEQQELALLTEVSPEVSEEQALAKIDQRLRRLASLRASRPAKG